MKAEQAKAMLKVTFDAVADTYDDESLRFFPACARHLAEMLELRGCERVLDVATGTGHLALELAGRLPRGGATGVDFSAGMLAQARRKAADRGAANADFAEMDMQDLGFADGEFDAATCAFGIFFVEDMEGALAHVVSKVRAGGKVAICSFRKDYFLPMRQLLLDRLAARGATLPPTAWERIASEAGSRKLLETAGLSEVRTEVRNAGYHLADENEWWDVVWNAGFRRLVGQLPAEDLPRFREEHLREVGAHKTGDGLWLDVGVVFSVGTVGAAGGA